MRVEERSCLHDNGKWTAASGTCYKTRYKECGKCGNVLEMDVVENHAWKPVRRKGLTFHMCGHCHKPR